MDAKATRTEALKMAVSLSKEIEWDPDTADELLSLADIFVSYIDNLPEHELTTLTTPDGKNVKAHITMMKD